MGGLKIPDVFGINLSSKIKWKQKVYCMTELNGSKWPYVSKYLLNINFAKCALSCLLDTKTNAYLISIGKYLLAGSNCIVDHQNILVIPMKNLFLIINLFAQTISHQMQKH